MKKAIPTLASCVLAFCAFRLEAGERIGTRFIDLVRDSEPAATIVVPQTDAPIWNDAVKHLTVQARRWSGAEPKVQPLKPDGVLPSGDVVLLGTPDTSQVIARLADRTESVISRVAFTANDGFAIESREEQGRKLLVVAGRSPRGAYNGAVLCRDLMLDATAGPTGRADTFIRSGSILRSPRLRARGTYCLGIYGVAMKYTAEDWKKIIDRHAEDGMERIYFWLSGHCPSERFPHLYNVDATAGTRLTVEGVRDLIRYCHDRGIRFYIGGGVFAWTASHYLMKDHPEIAAVKAGGICPSHPYAREANREHFLEMHRTWPEADGFMLEIRDEHGECQCEECQKRIDDLGSKAYGKAEITWLQELAKEAWKLNPKLHFCWLIGYSEHANDPYYYDQVAHMNDPRFEWLEVRVSQDPRGKWLLPGPDGAPRPFAFFSPRIAHWDPFYRQRIENLMLFAGRIADEGLDGYVPALEPGFGTACYYFDQIPLPVGKLPFTLTGTVYREITWNPSIGMEELKNNIRCCYFGAEAPRRFTDDLIYLRQFSLDHSRELTGFGKPAIGYTGETSPQLTVAGELKRVAAIPDAEQRKQAASALSQRLTVLANVPEQLTRMSDIERAMDEHAPRATPKTRDGFDVMRTFIEDTRAIYRQAVPDPVRLGRAISELE